MTTDSPQLLSEIEAALEADTRYAIQDLAIRNDGDNGRITIEGLVESIEAKRLAAGTVWQVVRSHRTVAERLRVTSQPAGELELRDQVGRAIAGESIFSESTITAAAGGEQDLLHDAGPDAPRIDIRVADKVVTLAGHVPSLSHRRFAEVLAWWAPACERVDNLLEVVPPEEDTDDEITDAVRMVLEKDPLVHASQIRAGTAGGIVELRGLVSSDEERRLAVKDAWYVPGVWAVIDRIEVQPFPR